MVNEPEASRQKKMIFMHDNAPSHAAHLTKDFLDSYGFEKSRLMTWPANSPDLNPIEHLWSLMKRRVYAGGHQMHSKAELWEAIQGEMSRLSPKDVQQLTKSMDARLMKVLQQKGGHTGM